MAVWEIDCRRRGMRPGKERLFQLRGGVWKTIVSGMTSTTRVPDSPVELHGPPGAHPGTEEASSRYAHNWRSGNGVSEPAYGPAIVFGRSRRAWGDSWAIPIRG